MHRYLSAPMMRSSSETGVAPLPTNPPRRKSFSKRPPQHRFQSIDAPMYDSDEGSMNTELQAQQQILDDHRRRSLAEIPQRTASPPEGSNSKKNLKTVKSNTKSYHKAPETNNQVQQASSHVEERRSPLELYAFPQEDLVRPSHDKRPSRGQILREEGAAVLSAQSAQRQVTLSPNDGSNERNSRQGTPTISSTTPQGRLSPPRLTNPSNPAPLRNPYVKVSGVEVHAALPRLQATFERAADRTRIVVHQYMTHLCPERADSVDKVMEQFDGREGVLVEALTAIFGDDFLSKQQQPSMLLSLRTLEATRPPSVDRAEPPIAHNTETVLQQQHESKQNASKSAAASVAGLPLPRSHHQQPPVGVVNSRATTPNQHLVATTADSSPLPPQPQQQRLFANDEVIIQRESSASEAAFLVDVDPVAAVMKTNVHGGIMTPPLPPDLIYTPSSLSQTQRRGW